MTTYETISLYRETVGLRGSFHKDIEYPYLDMGDGFLYLFDNGNCVSVPKGVTPFRYGTPFESPTEVPTIKTVPSRDCFAYVSSETGVDRQVVKEFLMEFFLSGDTIIELARKHKLSCADVSALTTAFDGWTGCSK